MKTVEQIVAAAENLTVAQLLRLRQKLDRLEKRVWEAEHARTTKELRRAKITDDDIDHMVMRHRRESRR